MDEHITRAAQHYQNLCGQGVGSSTAMRHTTQRFGVDAADVLAEIWFWYESKLPECDEAIDGAPIPLAYSTSF